MEMNSSPLSPHDATEIAEHLFAAKIFSLASCVMLFYDITITFGDEVEKIWRQRFTGATVLWFMNRYLSPLGYIIIIVSFHADWPKSVCNRYVLFPEILKVFTAFAIGVIFILRLYSIYGKSTFVLTAMSFLLALELGVKIWAFMDGVPVELPPGLVGCILTGKSDRIVFTWVAELVFDTIVFCATLARALIIYRGARIAHGVDTGSGGNHGTPRTLGVRRQALRASPLLQVMMRDGIIYFLVIFVANVVTTTLFMTLTADLKVINASFSTLITSLMVSRLILNLRSVAYRQRSHATPGQQSTSTVLDTMSGLQSNDRDGDDFLRSAKRRSSVPWTVHPHLAYEPGMVDTSGIVPESIIGNLGEPVNDWGEEDPPEYDADVSNYLGTHEMDDFIPSEQRSYDTLNMSPSDDPYCSLPASSPQTRRKQTHSAVPTGTDRIIVEITTRQDVHRDSLKPIVINSSSNELSEKQSTPQGHGGMSDHPSLPERVRSTWTAPREWGHMEPECVRDETSGNVSDERLVHMQDLISRVPSDVLSS